MENIQNIVLDKLRDNFSVQLTESMFCTSFFSPQIGLAARHFIDLIFEIENEFHIKFDEKSLVNPSFCTFKGFVEEIEVKTDALAGSMLENRDTEEGGDYERS